MNKKFSIFCDVNIMQQLAYYLVDLYENHRDLFKPDVEISSVQGAFKGIWCSTINTEEFETTDLTEENMRRIVKYFNDRGVAFRQVFDNYFIDNYLDDLQCNKVMEILNESGMNEVVLASDKALRVLKERYSNIHYISSYTKYLSNINLILNDLRSDYDGVIIWDAEDLLKDIAMLPEDYKAKTAILLSIACNKKCPYGYRESMYNSIYMLRKYNVGIPLPNCDFKCQFKSGIDYMSFEDATDVNKLEYILGIEDDLEEFVSKGINNFTLSTNIPDFDNHNYTRLIMYYLIQPNKYEEFMKLLEEEQDSRLRELKVIDYFESTTLPTLPFEEFEKTLDVTLGVDPVDVPIESIHTSYPEVLIEDALFEWNAVTQYGNSIYISNDNIGVLVTGLDSPDFDRKLTQFTDVYNMQGDDYYVLPNRTVTRRDVKAKLLTPYGYMLLAVLEPKQEHRKDLYSKIVLFNDSIIFEYIKLRPRGHTDTIQTKHALTITNNLARIFCTTRVVGIDIEHIVNDKEVVEKDE